MRLVRLSFRKLMRRPALLRTGLGLALVLGLLYVSVGAAARSLAEADRASIASLFTFPDAYVQLGGMLATFAGLAAAAVAGAVAGSEWSWGTFRVAVARGASRGGYVTALVTALALFALLGLIVLYVIGLVFVGLGGAVGGVGAGDPLRVDALTRLPVTLAACWLAIVMEMAIGFAVAFATRSQVAGIVAVVGIFFAEEFASILVPAELMRLAPITAANTVISTAGSPDAIGTLALPLAMTVLYLAAALLGTVLVARRVEVT